MDIDSSNCLKLSCYLINCETRIFKAEKLHIVRLMCIHTRHPRMLTHMHTPKQLHGFTLIITDAEYQ